jgi:hypothetical protein
MSFWLDAPEWCSLPDHEAGDDVRSPSGRWSTTNCSHMLLLPCPDYYLNVDDVFL